MAHGPDEYQDVTCLLLPRQPWVESEMQQIYVKLLVANFVCPVNCAINIQRALVIKSFPIPVRERLKSWLQSVIQVNPLVKRFITPARC